MIVVAALEAPAVVTGAEYYGFSGSNDVPGRLF
jgi:hypothetical protein